MIRKLLRALSFVVETIIAPAGTNLLGLTLAFAIFLPLGILLKKFGARIEGVMNFIGGGLLFGVDWLFRRPREFRAGQSLSDLRFDLLFDSKQGGRLLYLPCWIWGGLWMISGIVSAVIALLKG